MEEIDVAKETGAGESTSALRARAKAAAESAPAVKPTTGRVRVSRELELTASLQDVWTGEVTHSWKYLSRVPDGAEQSQIVRFASQLAGLPMDRLANDDREWFRSLARAEIQIRAASGTGLPVDGKPEARLSAFINMLWEDPELLGQVVGRLAEHEARFRFGDPRESEGAPKFPRVVVSPIGAADVVPAARG